MIWVWVWVLAFVVTLVVLVLIAARRLDPNPRCPRCGRDMRRDPHHPRCNYWRDR